MILALYADNPDAEITLYSDDGKKLQSLKWQAERRLAKELLGILKDELTKAKADFTSLKGIVVFKGPGSFTGLRIGATTANTIAYAQGIPVVGAMGENWRQEGLKRLANGEDDRIVLPHYGAEANISKQKK